MKGEIELYNISFLILKVELHFNLLVDGGPSLQKIMIKTEALWPRFSDNAYFRKYMKEKCSSESNLYNAQLSIK